MLPRGKQRKRTGKANLAPWKVVMANGKRIDRAIGLISIKT
jgi:hypothetical protein